MVGVVSQMPLEWYTEGQGAGTTDMVFSSEEKAQ